MKAGERTRARGWLVALTLLAGCGGPEPAPDVDPAPVVGAEPVAAGPGRDVPELGRPRPKLLPAEASAGAGRE